MTSRSRVEDTSPADDGAIVGIIGGPRGIVSLNFNVRYVKPWQYWHPCRSAPRPLTRGHKRVWLRPPYVTFSTIANYF